MSEVNIEDVKFSKDDRSFLKGVELLELQLYGHAVEKFRSVLSKDPNDANAHRMLALALAGERRFEASEHEARTAMSLAPDEPESFYILGTVLGETGKFDEAETVFQKAVEKNPRNQDFLNSLAQVKNLKGDYAQAEKLSLMSLELTAIENPWATGNLAISYQHQKKYDEAMKIYMEALKTDPENPALRNNVGVLFLLKNKPVEALEHFRASLRSQPDMREAKENIIRAIKAKNFLYGIFWQYSLFLNRFSFPVQVAILIGSWFIVKSLGIYAKQTGKYVEFIYPIMLVYGAFALCTWIVPPIFDKLVRDGVIK